VPLEEPLGGLVALPRLPLRAEHAAHETHTLRAQSFLYSWHELEVHLEDLVTGLQANVIYRVLEGSNVLRSRVRLTNGGPLPVTVESVTSLLGSGLAGPRGALSDVDLLWAENDWFGEGRWRSRALRDILLALDTMAHKQEPRARSPSRMSGAGRELVIWEIPTDGRRGQPPHRALLAGRSRTMAVQRCRHLGPGGRGVIRLGPRDATSIESTRRLRPGAGVGVRLPTGALVEILDRPSCQFALPSAVQVDGGVAFVASAVGGITEVRAGDCAGVAQGSPYGFHDPGPITVAGGHLFVANGPSGASYKGSISELDTSTGALTRIIPLPADQFGAEVVARAAAGSRLYVVGALDQVVELGPGYGGRGASFPTAICRPRHGRCPEGDHLVHRPATRWPPGTRHHQRASTSGYR
jgi:Glycosyl hydrolase family 36 N-terminal domain